MWKWIKWFSWSLRNQWIGFMINGHALDDCSVCQVKGKTEKLSECSRVILLNRLHETACISRHYCFCTGSWHSEWKMQNSKIYRLSSHSFQISVFKYFLFDGVRIDFMKSTICNFHEKFFPVFSATREEILSTNACWSDCD